ncbi:lipocalin-like domain-containing protein [Alloacidobacterium sp.]|uniref:lipocalin-like domain-containing protein n=1 Tax=Alloacidobacterium sp. TaxID=2951999 RepID=UPI002D57352E|nr:lipocalin-like domain-containing protein [Alloacidobacterium sp.]HYK34596.1 lipocalin-like domain-containing protein [Alloacidobacterium sp.]
MSNTKEAGTHHTTASDFVGTWKLVDYSFLREDGTVEKPWGDHVVGYLLYSAEGYMSGNLSPAGRRHNVEKASRKRDYIAYAGPYTVEGDTVTHHVEVSLFPNWLGTAQLRYHKREGNRLILRTPPIPSGDGVVAVQLTWEKVVR